MFSRFLPSRRSTDSPHFGGGAGRRRSSAAQQSQQSRANDGGGIVVDDVFVDQARSLPGTPIATQRHARGMQRLDQWIGRLLQHGARRSLASDQSGSTQNQKATLIFARYERAIFAARLQLLLEFFCSHGLCCCLLDILRRSRSVLFAPTFFLCTHEPQEYFCGVSTRLQPLVVTTPASVARRSTHAAALRAASFVFV